MKLAAILLVTFLVATGCAAQPSENSDMAADEMATAGEYAGARYSNVVASLGAPESEEDFVMVWGELEFRIELRNFFDRDDIEAGKVILRESTWSLDGPQNLTVWFQQEGDMWAGVHSRLWEDGDLF